MAERPVVDVDAAVNRWVREGTGKYAKLLARLESQAVMEGREPERKDPRK